MKKTSISLALACAASAAQAATSIQNFNWASQTVSLTPTQAAVNVTVPGFNPALGTLTGVAINLTSGAVVGSASVVNQGTSTSSLSLILIGNHAVSINGLGITTPVNATSAGSSTAPGGTASLVTPSTSIAGANSTANTAGWIGGNIPVLLSFVGAVAVNASPQVTFQTTPMITSSGAGTVTYTYTTNGVPEAETYVAGIALAGFAAYGFHRRHRKG